MASRSRTLRTRREVVRRHRRERQFLVFGLLVGLLATISVIALAIYQGRINSPVEHAFMSPDPDFSTTITVPCPPLNEGDDAGVEGAVQEDMPMAADQVVVRVLNGTEETGLAGSTLEVLTGRGYVSVGAANWNRTFSGAVRIQFGEEGLRQAYTVARNFPNVELVLDNRAGAVVDIILGAEFDTTNIRAQGAPELDNTVPLTSLVPCLPIAVVPTEPAPRIIPVDPLAPIVTPSPTPTPEPTPAP